MRATSHNVLWGLSWPYEPFFGFCFSSHTRNNYVIVVWKSLKLPRPQSPSKGNRGKEKQKETENEEARIEEVNGNKRTERKRHTETEYAAPDRLQGSNARRIQFSLCDLQLPVANKVSFARKKTSHAQGHAHACATFKKEHYIKWDHTFYTIHTNLFYFST